MPDSEHPEEKKEAADFAAEIHGLGRACLVAVVGGILIGIIGAVFRAGLSWIGDRHTAMVEWAQAWPWIGWILPVLVGAIGAGVARWLVRPQPLAAGSGVQHLEAIMRGEAKPLPLSVVPIKFFGGLIGIGAGLALGREGPTIQMGATLGSELARRFRCAKETLHDLQAALGGAGLAVAFNAPVGGAMFVFEELARTFRLRLTLVTLIGSACAITVSRMILGTSPDFVVAPLLEGEPWELFLYGLFGAALGLLGVAYNRTTLFALNRLAGLRNWPMEVRAALVGAVIGAVAWFAPLLVGGGDLLSQEILKGGTPIATLLLILVVRWGLGPLSYAAGTPGGIFSPLLLVGATLGALFAGGFNAWIPGEYHVSAVTFGVVGMVAFFTGIVRAPMTGIILITEMTATSSLLIPMLVAAFGAMLSASLVRGEPIYDTLRRRMLAAEKRS